jgi:restriction system protein
MGGPAVRSFLGGRQTGEKGLYVSTGGFTKDARYEAERANVPLTLLTLDEVVDLLIENYDRLDDSSRILIPLRRFYWPTT